MEITVTINNVEKTFEVEPWVLLADFVRTRAGLTGTHIGCDTTSCGVCTVLLDGVPVKSCTLFAVQANGRSITTVEGLAHNGDLDPVQQGFKECHGLQCGFCTPAMMLVSRALLDRNPDPTEDEIRWELSGNLCRCTGYVNIVRSVQWAAQHASQGADSSEGDA
jgi:carbon-monoxide dehydrogenase small subunit